MKIVAINSVREIGGGEKWLLRQGARWQHAGHRVTIIGRPGALLGNEAPSSGLRFLASPMRHDLSLPSVWNLAALLRREAPDVVLCCTERAFRLGVTASRLAGRPPIICRNGLTGTFKNKRINRDLFRHVTVMVVNAAALRDELASFGWVPEAKLRIIRNGVDLAAFAADPEARQRVRTEAGTPTSAIVIGCLGRLTEDKGLLNAIRAFASLANAHPHAELWLAGEGNQRAELAALVSELKLQQRVRFLGFRNDIPAVLQAVDVVLQASYREGLSNTILEAMSAARPVVATQVGGALELVEAGVTGEIIPPGDVAAIERAMEPLLADAERRRNFGEAARRRVEERFPLEGETRAWLELFGAVAAGKPLA